MNENNGSRRVWLEIYATGKQALLSTFLRTYFLQSVVCSVTEFSVSMAYSVTGVAGGCNAMSVRQLFLHVR
jgi:hypothetical protein